VAQCTNYSVEVTNISGCSTNSSNWTSVVDYGDQQLIVSDLTANCEYNVNVTTVSDYFSKETSVQATGNTTWTSQYIVA
jgi:hypothetical protein